jgi:hypothetical protein
MDQTEWLPEYPDWLREMVRPGGLGEHGHP